jgi:hypothetical protein
MSYTYTFAQTRTRTQAHTHTRTHTQAHTHTSTHTFEHTLSPPSQADGTPRKLTVKEFSLENLHPVDGRKFEHVSDCSLCFI